MKSASDETSANYYIVQTLLISRKLLGSVQQDQKRVLVILSELESHKDQLTALVAQLTELVAKDPVAQTLIEDANTSVRLANCCRNHSVQTLGELAELSARDLMKWKHFGVSCLREVRLLLAERGLALHGEALARPR